MRLENDDNGDACRPQRIPALIITMLFVLCSGGICAQTDSLKQLLSTASGKHRISILNRLAEAVVEEHPEQAISYASEASQLAGKEGERKEEAKAAKLLGDATYYLNNFRDAVRWYEKSALIEKKRVGEESEEYLSRTGDIGYCYLKLNNYEKALQYFTTALELARKTGNLDETAINYNNIGSIYAEWGDYGTAIGYFQKAMSIDEQTGKKEVISTDLNNIGKLYESWGNYDQAIKYYNDALIIDREAGNNPKIALRLNNLGLAHKQSGKYMEALEYFDQALKIERDLGDMPKIGKRLHNIGSTYFAMGQTETALTYYTQALDIFQKMEMPDDLARMYNSLGNYYLQKKDFKQAVEQLNKSNEWAEKNGLKPLLSCNYQLLSEAFAQKGDYKNAFMYYQRYTSLKDAVFTLESNKKLSEFRARFDSEKMQLENEMLRRDAKQERRNRILAGMILGSVLLILFGIIHILRLRNKTAKQARELSEQKAEQYKKDLEIRNSELTFNAMCIIKNNETITRMIEGIEGGMKNGASLNDLQSILNNLRNMEHDHSWKEFEVRFTQVQKDFYDRLNIAYPDLTPNEKKLCAFLRLNMTTKDIASITHQSPHSINIARGRLRKKLDIVNSDENLVNFLAKF